VAGSDEQNPVCVLSDPRAAPCPGGAVLLGAEADTVLSPPTLRGALLALSLGLLVGACSREASEPRANSNPDAPRLDADQLLELGLTREIPDQVLEACAEARRLASVRVLCPRVIPNIPITHTKGSYGSIVFADQPRVYMLSFDKDFFNPPQDCGEAQAQGNCPGVKHWIVGGGDAGVVEKWILTDLANEVKGDAELMESREVDDRLVLIYRFPTYPAGGVNGSHGAAVVEVGEETVFASLHGRRYVEAAVEMALDLADQAAGSSA
jgi:hypothetical protein